jgi:type IV secretory pathway VirB4 component
MSLLHRHRNKRPSAGGGLWGPDAIEAFTDRLCVGQAWCRTFAVTGYPREVSAGWLEPLTNFPARIEVALHVEPVPAVVAADRLRRQLARLESTRHLDADAGRLADPYVNAAADDARELAERLARGEGKLFRVGLYITVWADDPADLQATAQRLRALAASLLLDARPATFRALHGWITTLPLGIDGLRLRRTMDTAALAAAFPFASPELAEAGGVFYGRNAASQGLVFWDRWVQDNHNAVILARSGSGKSYLAKLEALRSLYTGVEVAVIDPEDEYRRLAEAVGGVCVRLGAPGVRLNPFDLGAEPDALMRRGLFCHTLISVLLGGPLDPATTAALDRAVITAYQQVGITADPRTWARPAPLLTNLVDALSAGGDPAAQALAGRLAPYVTGSYRGLFNGATTTKPDGHLVVFCLRDLPDELKAVGTLLALDVIWRRVANLTDRRRRLVVVDEAWLLMHDPEGARFLYRLAKSARKHWAGLTVITQDAADLLGSDLGQAVVANAATQILLRQAPQAIDRVACAFGLSDGERAFLLAAGRGEAILAAGTQRVSFQATASPTEHQLVTTDPAELVTGQADAR